MGVVDEIHSFGQSVACALGISSCWRPEYDWSPEMCLAYGLGMVQGLPLSNDRSYDSGMSEHNSTAKGHGQQLIQMYNKGDIIIKIDGELWEPKTQNEEGEDIWNHESDKIWGVLNNRMELTIELGELEEDDKYTGDLDNSVGYDIFRDGELLTTLDDDGNSSDLWEPGKIMTAPLSCVNGLMTCNADRAIGRENSTCQKVRSRCQGVVVFSTLDLFRLPFC